MTSVSRWPMLAPAAAIGLLVLGLALNAAIIIYDLTHWDVVYYVPPEEAANRSGLIDLATYVFNELALVLSGLAVVGLVLSMVGLIRGRTWAHASASILTAPFALCCGLAFIKGQGSFTGNPDAANNITPRHTSAPTWVLVGDVLGPPLLVGAAVIALILLFAPPVYRHFYPSQ